MQLMCLTLYRIDIILCVYYKEFVKRDFTDERHQRFRGVKSLSPKFTYLIRDMFVQL